MARSPEPARYPRLSMGLPPHLHARLQAASLVLKTPVQDLVEKAVESHISGLGEDVRELIDRVAAETVMRTERE